MRKLNSCCISRARHNTKSKCNNNITKKYITNKYMIGGSSNLAMPIPTLETLIRNTTQTDAIIQYRGVKFKCLLGKEKFTIGSIGSPRCIIVNYDFTNSKAYIESFFFNKEKHECIGVSKEINNTYFTTNDKNNKKNTKRINRLCLTLIDIININLRIISCDLMDSAEITIAKEYVISLSYKHIERGYGFYNEFGYLYIPCDPTDPSEPYITYAKYTYSDITINKNVAYANKCLKYLNTFFTQDKAEFEKSDFYDKYISNFRDLLTYEEYILSTTMRNTMILIIKNLNKGINRDSILLSIQIMIGYCFIEECIVSGIYAKFYKYYNNKIFTTELDTKYVNQSNNNHQGNNNTTYTLPYKFVLQEHKQQIITITRNTTDNLYQITITNAFVYNNSNNSKKVHTIASNTKT